VNNAWRWVAHLLQRDSVLQDDRRALVIKHVHVDIVHHLNAVLGAVKERRGETSLFLSLGQSIEPLLVPVLAPLHAREQTERAPSHHAVAL
jgi:hypothetical protein